MPIPKDKRALPASRKNIIGRPSDYSEELASIICERISDGESLKHITDQLDMPSRVTVHAWLIRYPEFLNKYEAARDLQADVYADEMDDIAHDVTIDTQRARLIIDTRKWTSSKLKPKKYGDKLDMTTNGKDLPTPILGGLSVHSNDSDSQSPESQKED